MNLMMTNDIFTKKTPLVIAVGAALGLSMQAAWAEEPEEPPVHEVDVNDTLSSITDGAEVRFPDLIDRWKDKDEILVQGGSITINGGKLIIENKVGALEFDKSVSKINLAAGSFENASKVYVNGGTLTVSGGTFSNSGTLTLGAGRPADDESGSNGAEDGTRSTVAHEVSGSADFKNTGTLELEAGNKLTISFDNPAAPEKDDAKAEGEDGKYVPGKFVNSGTIVVNSSTLEIAASNNKNVVYDEEPKDLPTISLGDIEVNEGGKIVNSNTGYFVKVEEKTDGDEAKDSEPEHKTLVSFGTVTLNNAEFENQVGARESGESLVLNDASTAVIQGYSSWESLVIDEYDLQSSEADQAADGVAARVTVGSEGELTLKTLTISNADEKRTGDSSEGNLTLTDFVQIQTGDAQKESVTITGGIAVNELRGDEGRTFKIDASTLGGQGIDIAGASLSISNKLEQNNKRDSFTWETLKDDSDAGSKSDNDTAKPKPSTIFGAVEGGDVATLVVTGYDATWDVTEPETDKKEGGDDGEGDQPEGAWTPASIGSIAASGTSQFAVTDIRTPKNEISTGNDPALTENAVYAAKVGTISLGEEWYAAKASVDVSKLKPDEETGSGKAGDETNSDGELVDGKWDKNKYQAAVNEITNVIKVNNGISNENGKPVSLTSTIEGSDLLIDTLKIAKNVTTIDLDKIETDDGCELPKDAETTEITVDAEQHTDVTLNVTNSRLRVTYFDQQTGTVNFGTTSDAEPVEVIIDYVSDGKTYTALEGDLSFHNGLLALNAGGIDREELFDLFGKTSTTDEGKVELADLQNDKLVYIGNTVTFGEDARVDLGTGVPDRKEASTGSVTLSGETSNTDPEEKKGSVVAIGAGTTIAFNARVFNSNGLLAGTGDDAQLQVLGEVDLVGKNAGVGAFNLTQGFKLVDQNGKELEATEDENGRLTLKEFNAAGVLVDKAWGLEDANVYVNDKGQIVVGDANNDGRVTTSEIGALNGILAAELVDNVLAGNRDAKSGDQLIINTLLSKVHKRADGVDPIAEYSAAEAVREINSITSFGAVSALKAMTVDFSGYVQDQIEHHAYTIPHNMRGWWVQPIGSRLSTDELKAGGLTTGYSINTYGIMGGYDWTVPNGDIWGIAASYQSGDADGEGSALDMSSDVKARSLHIWAARHIGDLRVMGALSYMKSESESTMSTSVGSLSSDELAATAYSFGMRADLTKKFGSFKLVPHVGARVSMIDMDDFTVTYQNQEAFKFTEDKSWLFEVPVGVTAATEFEYQRWNVQPYVDVTLRGRFGDTDSTFTVTGAGSGAKSSVAYDVSGDFIGDLRLGYMSTFKDLNLGMSYGFSAGDAGRQNHSVEATLRIDLF